MSHTIKIYSTCVAIRNTSREVEMHVVILSLSVIQSGHSMKWKPTSNWCFQGKKKNQHEQFQKKKKATDEHNCRVNTAASSHRSSIYFSSHIRETHTHTGTHTDPHMHSHTQGHWHTSTYTRVMYCMLTAIVDSVITLQCFDIYV